MKTLEQIIKSKKLDWINPDITSTNFPLEEVRSSEYKLFHFDKYISSEDAVKKIEKEGYVAANLYELLAWTDWNEEDFVVGFGSSCVVGGGHVVPYLRRFGAERGLYLLWWGSDWGGGCRFLAVRTLSLTSEKKELSPSDSLTLVSRIEKLETDMEKIRNLFK